MVSTSTLFPLPPKAAAATLGVAVHWRGGMSLAVSATCPAHLLCPAAASIQFKSVTGDEVIAGSPLPDHANFTWSSLMGFLRHLAPHTFTPNRRTRGREAKPHRLLRKRYVSNYDIPWNPTRLIQRVGRVNRVDTKFDKIHTYNFSPTDEGNDLIKLKEAAEAKIHAFIQMREEQSANASILKRLAEIDKTLLTHDTALWDILIGLDMSNRVKVLDLVHDQFRDWQIVILTYSKAWFERMKDRLKGDNWAAPWKAVVLFEEHREQETSPRIVTKGSGDRLEMAASHLRRKDYHGAAVEAFWQVYGSRLEVKFPAGARPSAPDIWKAAKEQGLLAADIEARLNPARPYLFATQTPSNFNIVKFAEAASVLEELVLSA